MSTQAARARTPRGGVRRTRPTAPPPTQSRELVGLGVLTLGAFLAAQVHVGIGVGPLGGWMESGLRLLVGRLVLILPLLLIVLGILVILDHDLLRARPLRTGLVVGGLTLCLATASGSLGLGGRPRLEWFDPATMRGRGGVVGEALDYVAAHTAGSLGTALLVSVGLLAALTLITGASLGVMLRRSSRGAATAGRTAARGMATASVTVLRGSSALGRQVRSALDTNGSVVTLRRRRAPAPHTLVDGADSFPDLFDEEGGLPPSPALGRGGPAGDPAARGDAEVPPPAPVPRASAAPAGPVDPARLTPPPLPRRATPETDADADAGDPDEDSLVPVMPTSSAGVGLDGSLPDTVVPGRPEYRLPARRILRRTGGPGRVPEEVITGTSRRLEETLGHFGITATVADAVSGPRVTRYELQLAPGTKVGRISALRDDLAYALAAREELRIIAPIPGKQAVGVEVPNPEASLVTLGDIHRDFPPDASALMSWLGLDIAGKPVYLDIARMPHLLIAGSTGTGKSVCLNVLLASILLHASPNRLRMILIDPKKVELNHYESIPHLLTPVVTNMRDAAAVLANIVREMESRYELMGLARARNLTDWNAARAAAGQPPMPMVLVVIDELADLMMVSPAEVEDAIIRLAQKSRAVGIHLLLATQRPSADVITGMIKANVPSRIAFAVSSQVDSRVILDAGGAESLLGSGDMLFRPVGTSRLQRLQGAYVSEEEIKEITDHWRAQGRPQMRTELLERPPDTVGEEPDPENDEMLARAMETVVQQGTASVSLLQRRLGVGYARAGRLVDALERMGVVSGHEGSKPRTVLVGEADLPRLMSRAAGTAPPDEGADAAADGDDGEFAPGP
ncbi:MAG TPA: DNA translocase FtsK 4TM domain-containing protein [Miltoncostaeaceae bacterium]|nr:DNA translocase FtsK 4TM domain-containing protein [Miltoncostaeaceae bacterium]